MIRRLVADPVLHLILTALSLAGAVSYFGGHP